MYVRPICYKYSNGTVTVLVLHMVNVKCLNLISYPKYVTTWPDGQSHCCINFELLNIFSEHSILTQSLS